MFCLNKKTELTLLGKALEVYKRGRNIQLVSYLQRLINVYIRTCALINKKQKII